MEGAFNPPCPSQGDLAFLTQRAYQPSKDIFLTRWFQVCGDKNELPFSVILRYDILYGITQYKLFLLASFRHFSCLK